jgi:hypothetical protein
MGLKALAAEALTRNASCNEVRNTPESAAVARSAETPQALAERAAIIEEGAHVPREWAERFARLEATPAPAFVDPRQWLAVLNAAGRFLDQWGAKAAALGWTADELLSLDPVAPLARMDRRGAAFFLAGVEVVEVTAEAITVRSGGAVQRVPRRRP